MAGGNLGSLVRAQLKGDIISLKVKTGVHIFRGGIVGVDATGYAKHISDAAGDVFMGIAEEEADNTDGASGDISVRVRRHGLFSLKKAAASAITDVGGVVCASAAHSATVQGTIDLIGTTTNDIRVGKVVGRVEDTPGSGTFADDWLLVDINT